MLSLEITTQELRDMVRISTNDLDGELEMLKDAFLLDLSRSGVETIPEEVSLVKACLRLYLRWHQNYNGEAGRYMENYKALRNALALASEYRAGDED